MTATGRRAWREPANRVVGVGWSTEDSRASGPVRTVGAPAARPRRHASASASTAGALSRQHGPKAPLAPDRPASSHSGVERRIAVLAAPPRLHLVSKHSDAGVFTVLVSSLTPGIRQGTSEKATSKQSSPEPQGADQTMNTTIIDHCDVAAYRSWTNRRAAPAYLRGIPSWVWQSALVPPWAAPPSRRLPDPPNLQRQRRPGQRQPSAA